MIVMLLLKIIIYDVACMRSQAVSHDRNERTNQQINISKSVVLIIYRNLHSCQKYSFGDILRKFDGNRTFLIDSVCLLSSTPKIGTFYAVLQILHHGQNCEFCHMLLLLLAYIPSSKEHRKNT